MKKIYVKAVSPFPSGNNFPKECSLYMAFPPLPGLPIPGSAAQFPSGFTGVLTMVHKDLYHLTELTELPL